LPLNRVGVMNKVNRTLGDLEQKYEREPTAEEVADALEMTSIDVSDSIQMSARHLSVDAPFIGNDDNSLLDVLPDNDSYTEPDSPLIEESLKMEVENVLNSLSEREAEVIRLYFGLVNERSMTLEEIGERFKLTRERVRQIKEKSIRKLRHTTRSRNLRSYLG
ncbi:MAG: sigma-70 family RNA polymerase sigma factor, partial [Candidatus Marinimicrobia bacterium]|nr:sigma-70 family RNA polymerase sigma factor [Candidatus Neomarinimicrobiota bacterium]